MAAQILAFPLQASVRYDLQTVRQTALRAGLPVDDAVGGFIRSGYSRSYLTDLLERARRVRPSAPLLPGGAA